MDFAAKVDQRPENIWTEGKPDENLVSFPLCLDKKDQKCNQSLYISRFLFGPWIIQVFV